jgi:hypothetical protein
MGPPTRVSIGREQQSPICTLGGRTSRLSPARGRFAPRSARRAGGAPSRVPCEYPQGSLALSHGRLQLNARQRDQRRRTLSVEASVSPGADVGEAGPYRRWPRAAATDRRRTAPAPDTAPHACAQQPRRSQHALRSGSKASTCTHARTHARTHTCAGEEKSSRCGGFRALRNIAPQLLFRDIASITMAKSTLNHADGALRSTARSSQRWAPSSRLRGRGC